MNLPRITALQVAVLRELAAGDLAGHELRQRLADNSGIKKSGPSFYQLMARLEDSKLVKGWYEQKEIDGQVFRERRYDITAGGRVAATRFIEFADGCKVAFGA